MAKQIASPDDDERKRLFDEVQRVFAEHEPVVYFAAPRVYVAVSSRVTNLTPAISRPQTLWAPDTLAVQVKVRLKPDARHGPAEAGRARRRDEQARWSPTSPGG